MTRKEISEESVKIQSRLQEASHSIIVFSHSLVPVLRDCGREFTAKELERLLFMFDASVEEGSNLLKDNIAQIVDIITGRNQT